MNVIKSIVVEYDGEYASRIRNIRSSVFTEEQHINPDLDFDGQDRDAVHVLIIFNEKYVGTGRMLSDGHIGRLAVLKEYRGQGLGAKKPEQSREDVILVLKYTVSFMFFLSFFMIFLPGMNFAACYR